mmetsp:Transcript_18469/g.36224  ORF Transcript_18469/g.36224 Transcript_18469/m.36224 type:complete len:119 (-) Transcript_18469:54-410(-)
MPCHSAGDVMAAIQYALCHSRARRARHHCCSSDNVGSNWSITGLRLVCATPQLHNANANIWRRVNGYVCACAKPPYFGWRQLAHVVGASACALLIVSSLLPLAKLRSNGGWLHSTDRV